MDEIASFNQSRWDELARKGVIFSKPFPEMSAEQARHLLDPHQVMGDVRDKEVLCLASGGGQQSVAFYMLGARVTVFDLSTVMLERDREAAARLQTRVDIQQGDMRDLSCFSDPRFDIVWHAYSINFIPDPRPVFKEVARVLRPGGLYRIEFQNPLVSGLGEDDWDGQGYPLRLLYEDGAELTEAPWEFEDEQGQLVKVNAPREFRHTLSGVINPLANLGFTLIGLWEDVAAEFSGRPDPDPTPGTWQHFIRIAPPWLTLWWRYQ